MLCQSCDETRARASNAGRAGRDPSAQMPTVASRAGTRSARQIRACTKGIATAASLARGCCRGTRKGRRPRRWAGASLLQIDTPDSVEGDHLSRRPVAGPLEPPTRDSASRIIIPVWRCTAWGLPSRLRHRNRWCALTAPFHPYPTEVRRSIFCGALPSGYPA